MGRGTKKVENRWCRLLFHHTTAYTSNTTTAVLSNKFESDFNVGLTLIDYSHCTYGIKSFMKLISQNSYLCYVLNK